MMHGQKKSDNVTWYEEYNSKCRYKIIAERLT